MVMMQKELSWSDGSFWHVRKAFAGYMGLLAYMGGLADTGISADTGV